MAEEARATPNVVTWTFLVNGLLALVLFYSGATRPFVSHALSKRSGDAPGELDYPLEVEISDDRSVRVSGAHRGCSLNLFRERYQIDLVPIPLHKSKVIVGMDWLIPNGEMIDCGHQSVRVQTPS
ncbi:hypothetical protein Lser_V15G37110 [Lactuca serriola]